MTAGELVRRAPERVEQKTLEHNPFRESAYALEQALNSTGAAFAEAGAALLRAGESAALAANPDGPSPVIDVEFREVQ